MPKRKRVKRTRMTKDGKYTILEDSDNSTDEEEPMVIPVIHPIIQHQPPPPASPPRRFGYLGNYNKRMIQFDYAINVNPTPVNVFQYQLYVPPYACKIKNLRIVLYFGLDPRVLTGDPAGQQLCLNYAVLNKFQSTNYQIYPADGDTTNFVIPEKIVIMSDIIVWTPKYYNDYSINVNQAAATTNGSIAAMGGAKDLCVTNLSYTIAGDTLQGTGTVFNNVNPLLPNTITPGNRTITWNKPLINTNGTAICSNKLTGVQYKMKRMQHMLKGSFNITPNKHLIITAKLNASRRLVLYGFISFTEIT